MHAGEPTEAVTADHHKVCILRSVEEPSAPTTMTGACDVVIRPASPRLGTPLPDERVR